MAEQKKQHYIPRFYFKLFSPNKRSIEIYNPKSKNAYSGSYRKLCAKNYFYSKRGEVETSLSSIEGESSKVINKLVSTHDISSLTIEDAFTICAFLAFQNYRTEKEKINFDEILNLSAKHTLEYLLQTDEKYSEIYSDKTLLDHLKIEMNEGQLNYMFHMYAEGPILLNDLSPLILINKTQYDFIFSDAPVIFYNSYFNNLGHGTNELANIGLQIFFPLNPIRNPEITEMCRNMSSEIQAKREDAQSKLKENPANSQITHEYFEYINNIVRNYVIKWFMSARVFEDWWDDRFYELESPRDDPRFSALLDEFSTDGKKGPE